MIRVVLCHHCAVELTGDEGEHYVYACHACMLREHDLLNLRRREPDHPDLGWLEGSPVTLDEERAPAGVVRLGRPAGSGRRVAGAHLRLVADRAPHRARR